MIEQWATLQCDVRLSKIEPIFAIDICPIEAAFLIDLERKVS